MRAKSQTAGGSSVRTTATGVLTAETAAVPGQADVMSLLSVEERSYMSQSLDTEGEGLQIDVDSLVKGAEKTAVLRGNTPGSPLGSKRDKPPPSSTTMTRSNSRILSLEKKSKLARLARQDARRSGGCVRV